VQQHHTVVKCTATTDTIARKEQTEFRLLPELPIAVYFQHVLWLAPTYQGWHCGCTAWPPEATQHLHEASRGARCSIRFMRDRSDSVPQCAAALSKSLMFSGAPTMFAWRDTCTAGDIPTKLMQQLACAALFYRPAVSRKNAAWFSAALVVPCPDEEQLPINQCLLPCMVLLHAPKSCVSIADISMAFTAKSCCITSTAGSAAASRSFTALLSLAGTAALCCARPAAADASKCDVHTCSAVHT
jgi:hypothetical protein